MLIAAPLLAIAALTVFPTGVHASDPLADATNALGSTSTDVVDAAEAVTTTVENAPEATESAADATGDVINAAADTTTTGAVKTTTATVESVTEAAEPLVEATLETVEPATETITPTVQTATEIVEPLAKTAEPVVETVTSAVEPVVKTVSPTVQTVTEFVEPVTEPVIEAVVQPTADIITPVIAPLAETAEPIVETTHEPVRAARTGGPLTWLIDDATAVTNPAPASHDQPASNSTTAVMFSTTAEPPPITVTAFNISELRAADHGAAAQPARAPGSSGQDFGALIHSTGTALAGLAAILGLALAHPALGGGWLLPASVDWRPTRTIRPSTPYG